MKGELKKFEAKALVSGDKGIKLEIYVIANDQNKVDMNELHSFLHQPLNINLTKIQQ